MMHIVDQTVITRRDDCVGRCVASNGTTGLTTGTDTGHSFDLGDDNAFC